MIMKALRLGLGNLIVFGDYISRPARRRRTEEAQAAVNEAAAGMSLYQFYACPFCVKTRRTLYRLNVPVELRDARNNEEHRRMLLEQGGRIKVPCLRIEEHGETIWMYESRDIITYLNERFAAV
ncbi:MAG: glutathione S-transferase N-terminal domain-containing protein [Porticoccaceae bacterium]